MIYSGFPPMKLDHLRTSAGDALLAGQLLAHALGEEDGGLSNRVSKSAPWQGEDLGNIPAAP